MQYSYIDYMHIKLYINVCRLIIYETQVLNWSVKDLKIRVSKYASLPYALDQPRGAECTRTGHCAHLRVRGRCPRVQNCTRCCGARPSARYRRHTKTVCNNGFLYYFKINK